MLEDIFVQSIIDEEVEFLPLISVDEDEDKAGDSYPDVLPILPLRNTVLFPGVVLPITVGRDKSIKAVREAVSGDKLIGVIAQKDGSVEDPEPEDLNGIGTVAKIVKQLRMPDGTTTVIIQGKRRFQLGETLSTDPFMKASIQLISDKAVEDERELEASVSSLRDLAGKIVKLSPNIPSDASIVLQNIESPSFLMHFISSNLSKDITEKQRILEENDLTQRAQTVLKYLNEELQMLELKNQIQSKVKTDIEKQQRDYFLNQQLKTIQEELGGNTYDKEIEAMRLRSRDKKWSKEIGKAFTKELDKLGRINPSAAEYSVLLNYCEIMLDLPWGEYTEDNFDIRHAEKVLEKDHFGLEKVKQRLLEYLAVLKLKGDMKSPILCLVGPPGVGKTSLGQSVARALNRKYVRMSLGGLHDESEIRGHRKTYIGAMPGRIIQSLKKVQSSNPVFILDEIDKVGSDFRGDPSSALLEVLDPEQNTSFYDNYLEQEYDLSHILFIATANNLNNIQPALRDRMEVIYINGYSTEEKVEIAKRHLVRKQREAHGLKANQVKIGKQALELIIQDYTRESGVRDLDRKIASVMRSVAKSLAMEEDYDVSISQDKIKDVLGVQRYDRSMYREQNPAGVATGLAWTSVGGEILFVETSLSNGKAGLTLTGNLGNVMKESASTALSYLRANAPELGIDPEMLDKRRIHIHVPEGAIPKDGPSAGITMLSSLTSAFSGRKVRSGLAMTGEITLRGKVLPVGGIKEKILAAKRAGINNIILCRANEKDVSEINPVYIKGLKFHYVDKMAEVLDLALTGRKRRIDVN